MVYCQGELAIRKYMLIFIRLQNNIYLSRTLVYLAKNAKFHSFFDKKHFHKSPSQISCLTELHKTFVAKI